MFSRKNLEAKKRQEIAKKNFKDEVNFGSANSQCFKKSAYPTERRVIAKINSIAEEGRRGLRYYLCPLCRCYHISHKKIASQKFIS
jgi:hypothetical protein